MNEAVEQRATVVAEGGAGVGVDLEGVVTPQVLKGSKKTCLWLHTRAP